jgi:hypothetical protein
MARVPNKARTVELNRTKPPPPPRVPSTPFHSAEPISTKSSSDAVSDAVAAKHVEILVGSHSAVTFLTGSFIADGHDTTSGARPVVDLPKMPHSAAALAEALPKSRPPPLARRSSITASATRATADSDALTAARMVNAIATPVDTAAAIPLYRAAVAVASMNAEAPPLPVTSTHSKPEPPRAGNVRASASTRASASDGSVKTRPPPLARASTLRMPSTSTPAAP